MTDSDLIILAIGLLFALLAKIHENERQWMLPFAMCALVFFGILLIDAILYFQG